MLKKIAIMESAQSLYINLFSEDKSNILKEVSETKQYSCLHLINITQLHNFVYI